MNSPTPSEINDCLELTSSVDGDFSSRRSPQRAPVSPKLALRSVWGERGKRDFAYFRYVILGVTVPSLNDERAARLLWEAVREEREWSDLVGCERAVELAEGETFKWLYVSNE